MAWLLWFGVRGEPSFSKQADGAPGSVPLPALNDGCPPGSMRPLVLLHRRQMLKRGPTRAPVRPIRKGGRPGLFPQAGIQPGSSLHLGFGTPSQSRVSLCELRGSGGAGSLMCLPLCPSPFSLPFRAWPGLHCLPKSCDHDAAAHVLVHSLFYYASLAWTG